MNASPLPASRPDGAPPIHEGTVELAAAILARAAERGRVEGVAYAGLVTPREAWRLHEAGLASIVDVRTRPEWEFVGHVEEVPLIEWRPYGATAADPRFVDKVAARFPRDSAILLLCRSGVRSHHAATALAQAGFARAFNILEGFEGDQDEDGRRGSLGGWRHAGLPWAQG